VPFIGRGISKQIETDWIFHVGGIEICHVLNAVVRNVVQKVIRQIAVRINDADTAPGLNILENQTAEQGRFTRSAFADGVKVMSAVVVRKSEGQLLPPMFALP
jgi:RNase P protein component